MSNEIEAKLDALVAAKREKDQKRMEEDAQESEIKKKLR